MLTWTVDFIEKYTNQTEMWTPEGSLPAFVLHATVLKMTL